MLNRTGNYDEALQRFDRTGPEFDGYLSNHGPMVVEVLARRGLDQEIDRWTDAYARRLDEPPTPRWEISADDWQLALGKVDRAADWAEFFGHEMTEHTWPDVLGRWWPRLLPGIAAGATHGVIRVGHAVNALRDAESEPRRRELAVALGYWAARWQPLPTVRGRGTSSASELLQRLPRIADQAGGMRARLTQLADTENWAGRAEQLRAPDHVDAVPTALRALTSAVVTLYPRYAHGNPTMLVHAATAPNAIAMALPSLPSALWLDSFAAAWSASAAVFSAYAPAEADDSAVDTPASAQDALERAIAHGGEHVIKFTDAALTSQDGADNSEALRAVARAVQLDA